MLQNVGLNNFEELFSDIPDSIKLEKNLEIPKKSEQELKKHIKKTLNKNTPYTEKTTFLGAGVWPHYVPSHVQNLIKRSEFSTSYTPYQAEISQGILQALFEYQSMIAELTGLEIANSSIYDWASALGEAALMSSRITRNNKIIVPELIAPERLEVLKSYGKGPELEIQKIKQDKTTGQIKLSDLEQKLDDQTAAVYIENPNYLGHLEEDPEKIAEKCQGFDALFIVGVNPISLGVLKSPGEYGADIVVGEGQPLGNPINFGGPSLGIFACKDDRKYLRQIPGRLIGMTETEEGNTRGYCMVLQTREQHIRREKARSSLCTNQTLNAVAAAVYLSTLGREGLSTVARKSAKNAQYLMKRMNEIDGVQCPVFEASHFNEFVANFEDSSKSIGEINSELLEHGIQGGKDLSKEFSMLGDSSLWCSTEIHSREEIDRLVSVLEEILEG